MQLKCLKQNKFCSLLQCFRFWELTYFTFVKIFDYPTPTCRSTITNYHFMMLRCIFATKGSQIKQKYRHVCARGEPCLYRSPHIDNELCWPSCQTGSLSENGHPRHPARSCFFSTRKSLFVAVFSWTLWPWDRIGVFPAPAGYKM